MNSPNGNYVSLSNSDVEDGYNVGEPESDLNIQNPMTSALLHKTQSNVSMDTTSTSDDTHSDDDETSDIEEIDELCGLDEHSSSTAKLLILSKQSAPVILSFFLGLLGSFINLLFAGRFVPTGDRSVVFAGISLANMFANVTCLSLLIGMSSAVETLGSQHNGAGMS